LGLYLFLRLGLLMARALPSKRIADLCARLGGVVGRISPSRRMVAENLRAIEAAGGRHAEVGQVFESYGRYWGELLALAARPERADDLRLEVRGLDHLAAARERGAICALGAHMGNWDLLAHWSSREISGMSFLVERLRPPRLRELFSDIRRALGCRSMSAQGGGREMFRHLAAGGSIGMLADRVIGAGWREVMILGGRRRLPSAGMDLARRAGATLLPIFIRRLDAGFAIRIHPPLDDSEDPVLAYARVLEAELLAAPEQWCVLYPLHDAVAAEPALAARKAVAS